MCVCEKTELIVLSQLMIYSNLFSNFTQYFFKNMLGIDFIMIFVRKYNNFLNIYVADKMKVMIDIMNLFIIYNNKN